MRMLCKLDAVRDEVKPDEKVEATTTKPAIRKIAWVLVLKVSGGNCGRTMRGCIRG
jgi:hypothetical protein